MSLDLVFLFVANPSVNISLMLSRNEKVEYHITMKTYKPIVLKFWIKSGINPLYVSWTHIYWCCISLMILSQKIEQSY